jgi:hypothetical protein
MKRKKSKDWNREWGMPQSEVDEVAESFRAMQDCEHEWKAIPQDDPDRALFSESAEECTKCGGVQVTVTEQEFRKFEKVLRNGEE